MCCLQTDRISATHTPEEAADFSRNFSICCSVNSGVSSLPEDLFLIICLQDRGTYRARGKRWFYIYNTFFLPPLYHLKVSHRHVLRWCVGSESQQVLRLVLGSGAALGLDPRRNCSHPWPWKLPHSLHATTTDRPGKEPPTQTHLSQLWGAFGRFSFSSRVGETCIWIQVVSFVIYEFYI